MGLQRCYNTRTIQAGIWKASEREGGGRGGRQREREKGRERQWGRRERNLE